MAFPKALILFFIGLFHRLLEIIPLLTIVLENKPNRNNPLKVVSSDIITFSSAPISPKISGAKINIKIALRTSLKHHCKYHYMLQRYFPHSVIFLRPQNTLAIIAVLNVQRLDKLKPRNISWFVILSNGCSSVSGTFPAIIMSTIPKALKNCYKYWPYNDKYIFLVLYWLVVYTRNQSL